ncbi:phage tail protein [Campylobacter hyointestinalis]|uniref:Oxidoreductase n=1 Tax=Campylobacter hyointestinalis subsp. hyointestinalis TaxID=91352 RepID=A0A0S4SPS1_CAMHY|nr:phage tail protein [Campylobacter hyointestinalis]PPB51491.1 oxidoreductase [Campylobacter hyointestinalis subsp. hyointestinalis]PPB58625.1 oxidoreductase [Campylobacter hyointestinalis subsp. hyointestinalis]PPB60463.1 oxidoreductase [Campylobacter hyointestinalis subsp. hyointestinalis]PPB64167.1 oxidoreductase [Campylobacter hyointestinalis subsp. hyointestinalis]PPB64849.1 oxidoreductase [Campylobacter hyointestinalis subsp. hyointestinalis]
MVLSLGGFKFNWKQMGGISRESEFGISENIRIGNYPALFRANLGNESIKIDGHTLPYQGDKQEALKELYALAKSGISYPLVTGYGKYLGKFVIAKISESQAIFTDNGLFFTQNFSLELKKDYE